MRFGVWKARLRSLGFYVATQKRAGGAAEENKKQRGQVTEPVTHSARWPSGTRKGILLSTPQSRPTASAPEGGRRGGIPAGAPHAVPWAWARVGRPFPAVSSVPWDQAQVLCKTGSGPFGPDMKWIAVTLNESGRHVSGGGRLKWLVGPVRAGSAF